MQLHKTILLVSGLALLMSCNAGRLDTETAVSQEKKPVTITSSLEAFEGEDMTKVNVDGNDFLDGDFIRMKIICPFVSDTQRGEYTDGNSYDSFFYFKRSGKTWIRVTSSDGFDISGTYSASSSPDIASYYEAQQTPHVFVATTWSEERRFVAPYGSGGSSLYDHLTPVFHADQSKEKNYRASDVLWAQTFMQTGAWNIHLGFQHKMACLDITIDDTYLTGPNPDYDPEDPESMPVIPAPISADAVLTLEGMPDIDQAEIVIGDYYADASKSNSGYGYRQKSSCAKEYNGKVLGIAVNDEAAYRAKVAPLSGLTQDPGGDYSCGAGANHYTALPVVPNTGTYTAYTLALKHYRIIVPPCTLSQKAVFWLRDGSRRFTIPLERLSFAEGKLYNVTLKLGTEPKPEPEPEPEP